MDATNSQATPQRFLQIDEDGYFKMDDLRVADIEIGRDWLSRVEFDAPSSTATALIDGQNTIIEAFDAPYVVLRTDKDEDGAWVATMPYGHEEKFSIESLTLDEWDRFHGRTVRGVPFVFSRSAQGEFFESLDEFDDDSITDDGVRYETKPWLATFDEANQVAFWSERYANGDTPWDRFNGPHPVLATTVPQLKLLRSRILVAGCGRGHDAAWFAQAGHIVTAVDYSAEAIEQAKKLYGHIPNLVFLQADVFNLPTKLDRSFDIVFEHTLYCAIDPAKRNDLVKAWRRALADNGHLMGFFFCTEKRLGPPYGGSEWELRSRLGKTFRTLYWQRLKNSPAIRLGTELFVYSQKLPALR